MEETRALFRDPETTEFVIVTIPTVMAVAESSRLAATLRSEAVPVRSILINQATSSTALTSSHNVPGWTLDSKEELHKLPHPLQAQESS